MTSEPVDNRLTGLCAKPISRWHRLAISTFGIVCSQYEYLIFEGYSIQGKGEYPQLGSDGLCRCLAEKGAHSADLAEVIEPEGFMHALNPRAGQSASETIHLPNPRAGREATHSRQQIFQPNHHGANRWPDEGSQKLKNRLISRGLPESVVDDLLEEPMVISYSRGSFIFLQGAPTEILFWLSSGLVDILCPSPDGEQILASVLGPGEFFGFLECTNQKGRPAQAFQARARTNVQIGLLIREHICKVLGRQDPMLLIHIIEEVVAAWSSRAAARRPSRCPCAWRRRPYRGCVRRSPRARTAQTTAAR